jgi:hypothetical protein
MVAALAVSALAVPAAHAEIYVGFQVGGARIEASPADIGTTPRGLIPDPPPGNPAPEDVAGISSFAGSDIGTQFLVGWRARYFGAEIGYTNFNQMSRSYAEEFSPLPNAPLGCDIEAPAAPGGCQERDWRQRYQANGYQAAVLGYLPVHENIELFGKVGAIIWDSESIGEERVREQSPPRPPTLPPPANAKVTATDDGTDLMVGVGALFRTDSPFSVRVAIDYYDIGNTDEVIMYSVGAFYSWGRAGKK